MGLPITAGCDIAGDRTQVCSDASSTVMQTRCIGKGFYHINRYENLTSVFQKKCRRTCCSRHRCFRSVEKEESCRALYLGVLLAGRGQHCEHVFLQTPTTPTFTSFSTYNMDAGFFRGTSAEQDNRFSNKQKKLLKQLKFAECLEKKVDMTKVNLEVVKPWITQRVTEILGFEDDVVIEFIFNQLEEKA
uniref:Serine/arginine repetitive matrix 1 n=3 Tax=Salmoninae TaxID=504568 RepID=A0A674ER80_SALTR